MPERARAQCLRRLGPILSCPAALELSRVERILNTSSSVITMSLQVYGGLGISDSDR